VSSFCSSHIVHVMGTDWSLPVVRVTSPSADQRDKIFVAVERPTPAALAGFAAVVPGGSYRARRTFVSAVSGLVSVGWVFWVSDMTCSVSAEAVDGHAPAGAFAPK
jgi:hypothetical protein